MVVVTVHDFGVLSGVPWGDSIWALTHEPAVLFVRLRAYLSIKTFSRDTEIKGLPWRTGDHLV
jgi:hypothetical protein